MITGPFTAEQRVVLREIASRKAKNGEIQRLAREWKRQVGQLYDGISYARKGGYRSRRKVSDGRLQIIGPYTLLMRHIWAEWQLEHGL